MMLVLVDLLDFFMLVSFSFAISICAILYLGRNSKRALMIGIYFLIQFLLELVIRTSEVDNPMTRWWNRTFTTTVEIKGLFYTVILVSMMLVVLYMLELPINAKYFIAPCAISVFLFTIPAIQNKNMIFYGMYLAPCEAYYFGLSLYALRKLKSLPESKLFQEFRRVLLIIAGFAVIIFAEDFITSWSYGFFTQFQGFTDPTLGIAYIKERSFSESILQLILAGFVIYVGGRALVSALRAELQTLAGAPAPAQQEVECHDLDGFASQIGLSPREREVLPLLLENQSMQQISEQLYISLGTVKYHTHNVYQKAGVGDRTQLIDKFSCFSSSHPR